MLIDRPLLQQPDISVWGQVSALLETLEDWDIFGKCYFHHITFNIWFYLFLALPPQKYIYLEIALFL